MIKLLDNSHLSLIYGNVIDIGSKIILFLFGFLKSRHIFVLPTSKTKRYEHYPNLQTIP